MIITANKNDTSIKAQVKVTYDKPLFDMDKLASKQTIEKYDYYFRHVQDMDNVLYSN